ncbi:MAG: bifunctional serine/threonine-protein kinase/formylglycine-generating enzyme family protein [Myxococcota bacterium]|nr:bifunctional serine/threonine-protein kinase/formylglycine-generating enzyme family protein [Myxococcota bacterium]
MRDFNEILAQITAADGLSIDHLDRVIQAFINAGRIPELMHTIEKYRLVDPSELSVEESNTVTSLHEGDSVDISGAGSYHPSVASLVQAGEPMTRTEAKTEAPTEPNESTSPKKYDVLNEVARGGVGVIQLVRDKDLLRKIVMKTLIDGNHADNYVRQKFIEEAQITAQLEHPNIVPVHEFGYLSGGEVFFTMKRIQGRTLKDVLRKLRKGDAEVAEAFGRTRLINIFQSVCQAIAFAHSRGVLHRDIKPSNVMIGEYGETLVLDWGVAKVIGSEEKYEAPAEQVVTDRSVSDDVTMVGLITGTPSYMAPEQAAGRIDRLDARSDIYALGALLYEMLCLKPPFKRKTHRDTLKAVITEAVVPPSIRAPEQNVPNSLETIALKCLEKRRSNRFQSVDEMIETLSKYLAGVEDLDRRAQQSDERLEVGIEHVQSYDQKRAQHSEQAELIAELEWDIPTFASIGEKRSLWAAQTRLSALDDDVRLAFSDATTALVEAIGFNPDNVEACNELARLYWSKYQDALGRGDTATADEYRALVQTYDRGLFTERLTGDARLIVRSDPPGARVIIQPVVESDHLRGPGAPRELGVTPLNNVPLPEGDWILVLKLAGFRDVKHAVSLRRTEVTELSTQMYTDEQVGPHFLYVPGGRFEYGGDASCASARNRRAIESTPFFMSRYPVTCAEYLAFLRSLGRKRPDEAKLRAPRVRNDSSVLWDLDENGLYCLPNEKQDGLDWEPHWPIIGISFADAVTYCRWYSQRTGTEVRLPTEIEWEKAARSADGRPYPWGHYFDALFCKMAGSRSGTPRPERVGSFRSDCSVYGVYDMAGLIREYCDSSFSKTADLRVVRGGSYLTNNGAACRATGRWPVHLKAPSLEHGFRIVRDVPDANSKHERRLVRPQF